MGCNKFAKKAWFLSLKFQKDLVPLALKERHNKPIAIDQFCFTKILTCGIVANLNYNHRVKPPSQLCLRRYETEFCNKNDKIASSTAQKGANELDSSLQNPIKK
jgi:hypothetical protein